MVNYIKQNLVLIVIAAILLFGVFGNSQLFGATTARTTITNPWTFQEAVTQNATSTIASQGVPAYQTLGGIDFAFVENDLTATSSIPGIIANPFGSTAATSSLVSCGMVVTSNGIAVAQSFDVSTTTGTGGYGSSTPAIISGFAAGAAQFFMPCGFNSATTTSSTASNQYVPVGLLPGRTQSGASNYIIQGGEFLTGRIASSTPGTFSSYWTGKFWAVFMKL